MDTDPGQILLSCVDASVAESLSQVHRNGFLYQGHIPVHALNLVDVDLPVLSKDPVGPPLHQAVEVAHGDQIFKTYFGGIVCAHPPLNLPVQPSPGLHGFQIRLRTCSIVQIS